MAPYDIGGERNSRMHHQHEKSWLQSGDEKGVILENLLPQVMTEKILLYKTLIRPVVSYGAEAWTMMKKKEQDLLIFERKIFS
jgi:hypothetical protein